jgi:hypothetical protein
MRGVLLLLVAAAGAFDEGIPVEWHKVDKSGGFVSFFCSDCVPSEDVIQPTPRRFLMVIKRIYPEEIKAVVVIDPKAVGYSPDSVPAIQARQTYQMKPTSIYWGESLDSLLWCEDIFSTGPGVQFEPVEGFFYLLYGYVGATIGTWLPLVDSGISDYLWRSIRKCNKAPACQGCFEPDLQFYRFQIRADDTDIVLSTGRCKGYSQFDCSVTRSCSNGQYASNYRNLDVYSRRYVFPVSCVSCPAGTWNTCVDQISLPATTCSWCVSLPLHGAQALTLSCPGMFRWRECRSRGRGLSGRSTDFQARESIEGERERDWMD